MGDRQRTDRRQHTDRGEDRDQRVVVEVPGAAGSLRLLRLAVSDRMSGAGFLVAEVERGALVVDELAAVLLEAAEGARLSVEIETRPGRVELRGRAVAPNPRAVVVPVLGAVAEQILDAGVAPGGSWQLFGDDHAACFRAVLSREAPGRRVG